MKKGNFLLLFLASGFIIALLGLAAYLTIYIMDDHTDYPASTTQISGSDAQNIPGTAHAISSSGAPAYGDPDYQEAEHYYLFVGDSRTVGMQNAVNEADSSDPCTYIAKEGEGYSWFYNEGMPQLEAVLTDAPDIAVILNLGVNDLKEVQQYIDLYTVLFESFPQTSFYLLSVNPVEEALCENVTNAEIEAFNDAMRNAFPDQYLDSYSYLLSDDFQTVDGLHYPKSVYRAIHHFVVMIL